MGNIVDTSFSAFYKKKVLVTGHTGFKGSWLCIWLKLLGAEVCGVALDPVTKPSHYLEFNLQILKTIVLISTIKNHWVK